MSAWTTSRSLRRRSSFYAFSSIRNLRIPPCLRASVSFFRSVLRRNFFASSLALLDQFAARLFCHLQIRPAQLVEVLFLELLQIEQLVAGVADGPDQFVELHLCGLGVTVLCALNQEHHQERDDRRAGIDDELPGVAEVK